MGETPMADAENPRPSISSVDARVARLEEAQLRQDGQMQLIQLEQQHIREIMTSRFVSLEASQNSLGSKLDNFIGKMETLITEGMKQQADLEASPLGRQINDRIKVTETWVEISKEYAAEQRGQRRLVASLLGTNVLSAAMALFAIAKTLGWV